MQRPEPVLRLIATQTIGYCVTEVPGTSNSSIVSYFVHAIVVLSKSSRKVFGRTIRENIAVSWKIILISNKFCALLQKKRRSSVEVVRILHNRIFTLIQHTKKRFLMLLTWYVMNARNKVNSFPNRVFPNQLFRSRTEPSLGQQSWNRTNSCN